MAASRCVSASRTRSRARVSSSSRSRGSQDSATARASLVRATRADSAAGPVCSGPRESSSATRSSWAAAAASDSETAAAAVSARRVAGSTGAARRWASRPATTCSSSACEASSSSSAPAGPEAACLGLLGGPAVVERRAAGVEVGRGLVELGGAQADRRHRVAGDLARPGRAATGRRRAARGPGRTSRRAGGHVGGLLQPRDDRGAPVVVGPGSVGPGPGDGPRASARRPRSGGCGTGAAAPRGARPRWPGGRSGTGPAGSIATWVNCVQVIPRSPVTRCPASSRRLVRAVHPSSRSSSTTTWAWMRRVPSPRRRGRSHAGERVNRNVRPPTLNAQHDHGARPRGRRGRCAGGGPCAGRRGPRRRGRSRPRRGCSTCRHRCRR